MLKKIAILLGLLVSSYAYAGDVEIVRVVLTHQSGTWTANVTLKHADAGWDHYADAWRLVDDNGNEIATRTLYHPHVEEQPFTRSLSDFSIPKEKKIIFVEAHDKVHGWSPNRVQIDMNRASGDKYQIQTR